MGRYVKQQEEIRSTPKLEINPPEKNTRMKNDELEAREHLHEGSPDQNID